VDVAEAHRLRSEFEASLAQAAGGGVSR
jgi:hypothetical protein